jgi:hypothetical protein
MSTENFKPDLKLLNDKIAEVKVRYGFTDKTFGAFAGNDIKDIHETTINRTGRTGFQRKPCKKNIRAVIECLFTHRCDEADELIRDTYSKCGFPITVMTLKSFNYRLHKSQNYINREPLGMVDAIKKHQENEKKPTFLETLRHYWGKLMK